jgi:pyruvate formate lyase activating enzyme
MPVTSASVLNIQRFTVHDGPGIRTEVFLQGCPLRCKWCGNPEGMSAGPEIMAFAGRCIGVDKCGDCLKACPAGSAAAFQVRDNTVAGVDRHVCTRCMECARACPAGALAGTSRKMTLREVMREILADREFYRKSGGGVTLSGGDPLSQWQFTRELLRDCKINGIHTCLESCLYTSEKILDHVYPLVDLVYTDIKHMDPLRHKEYTGVDNRVILRNIRHTVALGKPVVIRIPVVPAHNDDEENIRSTARFILDELHNRVVGVQLLPFRALGVEKYRALGMPYPMADVPPSERSEYEPALRRLADLFISHGIPATAGTGATACRDHSGRAGARDL